MLGSLAIHRVKEGCCFRSCRFVFFVQKSVQSRCYLLSAPLVSGASPNRSLAMLLLLPVSSVPSVDSSNDQLARWRCFAIVAG